jgi:hypothetical protein
MKFLGINLHVLDARLRAGLVVALHFLCFAYAGFAAIFTLVPRDWIPYVVILFVTLLHASPVIVAKYYSSLPGPEVKRKKQR